MPEPKDALDRTLPQGLWDVIPRGEIATPALEPIMSQATAVPGMTGMIAHATPIMQAPPVSSHEVAKIVADENAKRDAAAANAALQTQTKTLSDQLAAANTDNAGLRKQVTDLTAAATAAAAAHDKAIKDEQAKLATATASLAEANTKIGQFESQIAVANRLNRVNTSTLPEPLKVNLRAQASAIKDGKLVLPEAAFEGTVSAMEAGFAAASALNPPVTPPAGSPPATPQQPATPQAGANATAATGTPGTAPVTPPAATPPGVPAQPDLNAAIASQNALNALASAGVGIAGKPEGVALMADMFGAG